MNSELRRNEPVTRSFGQILRKMRQSKGLTQTECASLCGIGPRHFQKIEAGQVNPPLEFFRSAGRALKTKPCYFLNEEILKHPLSAFGLFCLSDFLDLLPVSTFVLTKSGELAYANKEFRRFFGRELQVFWSVFNDREERERIQRELDGLLKKEASLRTEPLRIMGIDQRIHSTRVDWRSFSTPGMDEPGILAVLSLLAPQREPRH